MELSHIMPIGLSLCGMYIVQYIVCTILQCVITYSCMGVDANPVYYKPFKGMTYTTDLSSKSLSICLIQLKTISTEIYSRLIKIIKYISRDISMCLWFSGFRRQQCTVVKGCTQPRIFLVPTMYYRSSQWYTETCIMTTARCQDDECVCVGSYRNLITIIVNRTLPIT